MYLEAGPSNPSSLPNMIVEPSKPDGEGENEGSEPGPVSVLLGNPQASKPTEDYEGFVLSDQLVAVDEALTLARHMFDTGHELRLLLMLDHKHSPGGKGVRVKRPELLAPRLRNSNTLGRMGRATAKWPRLCDLHPDIKVSFAGRLQRHGFKPSEVRVLPEESIWWFMRKVFQQNDGFDDYELIETKRRLYEEGEDPNTGNPIYKPQCIGVFSGALFLASHFDFQVPSDRTTRSPKTKYCFREVPRNEPRIVKGFFQKDPHFPGRVTRSLLDQAHRFLAHPDGLALPAELYDLKLCDQATVDLPAPAVPPAAVSGK